MAETTRPGTRTTAIAAALLLGTLVTAPQAGTSISIQIGDEPKQAAPKETVKHGPPDHAPAHGYRAKHQYRYYPNSEIYFDTARGMYFYLANGAWKIAATLPLSLSKTLGGHIAIELDSDKPYTDHERHKKQYPPGHGHPHDKHEKRDKGGKGKD